MGYKIGSFNMFKWSKDESKNLSKLADIIREEQFDIIAMQEVLKKDVLNSLMHYLPGWDKRWDSPRSYSNNAAEGYGFIWNTRRIGLAKYTENGVEKIFEPRILNQYKVDKKAGQTNLIRNPYYGRFTPQSSIGGGFFEIRLINTHINFGKKDNGEDAPGAHEQRNKEFDVLAKAVYPKYADKRYGNFMPAYTILLGDYNLNLRDSKCGYYLKEESVTLNDNGRNRIIQTFQSELSTLSAAESTENPQYEKSIYANNYDHFSYDIISFSEQDIKTGIGRVDAVRKYYNCEKDKYKAEISDHIPIYMTVDF